MLAGAWPPTEKAPLESVLKCWHIRGSHVVHLVENLRPQKKRTWTGQVMPPSTAELYPRYRNINRPKCADSSLRKEMVSFAEKCGKTAEKSGIRTPTSSATKSGGISQSRRKLYTFRHPSTAKFSASSSGCARPSSVSALIILKAHSLISAPRYSSRHWLMSTIGEASS